MKSNLTIRSVAFLLFLMSGMIGGVAHAICDPNGPTYCVLSGDTAPADIASTPGEAYTAMGAGLFEYSKTDLTIAAPMPIQVTRTYRSYDRTANGVIYGAFGLGTTLNYDIYLYSATEVASGKYNTASVVLPDGAQILCQNIDPACTQTSCPFNASTTKFQCNTQPTGVWFNSLISYDSTVPGGGGWNLSRKDGTVYTFGKGARRFST